MEQQNPETLVAECESWEIRKTALGFEKLLKLLQITKLANAGDLLNVL